MYIASACWIFFLIICLHFSNDKSYFLILNNQQSSSNFYLFCYNKNTNNQCWTLCKRLDLNSEFTGAQKDNDLSILQSMEEKNKQKLER